MCDQPGEPALKSAQALNSFLARQVFRKDYLIIESPAATDTHYPGKYKLERLHELCIMKGYRTPQACQDIKTYLHQSNAPDSGTATELNCLTLLQYYLPACVTAVPLSSADADPAGHPHASTQDTIEKKGWRRSWLDEEGFRYLLYLPPDVHALMIEQDGCLLAA